MYKEIFLPISFILKGYGGGLAGESVQFGILHRTTVRFHTPGPGHLPEHIHSNYKIYPRVGLAGVLVYGIYITITYVIS